MKIVIKNSSGTVQSVIDFKIPTKSCLEIIRNEDEILNVLVQNSEVKEEIDLIEELESGFNAEIKKSFLEILKQIGIKSKSQKTMFYFTLDANWRNFFRERPDVINLAMKTFTQDQQFINFVGPLHHMMTSDSSKEKIQRLFRDILNRYIRESSAKRIVGEPQSSQYD